MNALRSGARSLYARRVLLGLLSALALLASCASSGREPPPRAERPYPRAAFVVISDPHVYDASLGTEGPAFARATTESRVLYGLSAELFGEAVTETIAIGPDFVLLPGDLTKDGEVSSHAMVAKELSRLAEAGIRVYAIPGNHDLDNPRARRYEGRKSKALPSLSAADFAKLYAPFGYEGALSRDADSLSYVARLAPGLRLLALDSFAHPKPRDPSRLEPDSSFGPETLAWIRSSLEDADREGDAVIAMAHMSLLEHFKGQAKYLSGTFSSGGAELAALLASHGVRLAFTGHIHAQDVALGAFPGGERLYDVSTGSLAGYPLAFRLVEIKAGEAGEAIAAFRSLKIASIPSVPEGLEAYARDFLNSKMTTIFDEKLKAILVPKLEADLFAKRLALAYIAFAQGDESPTPGVDAFPAEIRSLPGRLAVKLYSPLLGSLWRDLPPADNDLVIDLGNY
jgi:hypothetical protein